MKYVKILVLNALILFFGGCTTFLDEKTDRQLAVPQTLEDLQSLLDNYSIINGNNPGVGELSADDLYLLYDVWTIQSEPDQRAYTWEPNYTTVPLGSSGWSSTYRVVYWANIVIKTISAIDRTSFNQREWDNIKGQAHFLRAFSFLQIAAIWAPAYDEQSAATDLGIPLRLTDDYNIPSKRSSVAETYKQILEDLKIAISLLPVSSKHVVRASKPAALAILARAYLFMRSYDKCLEYASAVLQMNNGLMDYNEIDPSPRYPIPQFNREVLYHSVIQPGLNPAINLNNALVDTALFGLYHPDDLRKSLYFRQNTNGTTSIRGNYSGGSSRFSGVAIDEVYLMRAECRARLGDDQGAIADLNYLLTHRFIKGTAASFLSNEGADEILGRILEERRKELIMRGLRFPDVKRLNKEGAGIGFKRVLGDRVFELSANDLRFAVAIPEEILELAPLMQQNPR